jgi:hypothetical protein
MQHLVKRNFDGEWSVLPLRHVANASHPVLTMYADPSAKEFADAPALRAMPYLRTALSSFQCPLQTVRLMRLGPKSTILPHRDVDLAAEAGSARIHVPIATNDGVRFDLNGHQVAMMVGSVWYLRLSDTHSVVNAGDTMRVHLVIDCVVNGWLMSLLRKAAHTNRPSSTVAGSIG